MKNEIVLNLRKFPVLAHDHRDGQEKRITVTVAKNQLQAAQIVGQSSKELIERLCERQGYTVFEIGKPFKVSVAVDLDKLVEQEEQGAPLDPIEMMEVLDGEAGALCGN